MGIRGSGICLETLMCRILGDLMQEGAVAKVADDVYWGGSTVEETYYNWRRVLDQKPLLEKIFVYLHARPSFAQKTTTILGCIWSNGTPKASPHRLQALQSATTPSTVRGLRSFVRAYKVLSRVLRGQAFALLPLERVVAGRDSKEKVTWTDDLLHAFPSAKKSLSDAKVIHTPCPDDQLWIVTDASLRYQGLASTLYINAMSEFFNAQLTKYQAAWLPCEIEALAITAAVKHFSVCHLPAQVLTDSRPCVQAFCKLLRGEFSNSARVTTF